MHSSSESSGRKNYQRQASNSLVINPDVEHSESSYDFPPLAEVRSSRNGCWYRLRRSKSLVILIVFIAMMLDLMLITSVEPILPPLVYSTLQPNATDHFWEDFLSFRPPSDKVEMFSSSDQQGSIHDNIVIMPNILDVNQANLTCDFVVSLLRNASIDVELLNLSTIFVNLTQSFFHCENVTAINWLLSEIYIKNTTSENPYLQYAVEISALFSMKPAAEIFSNILSGLIVNRFGHRRPLVVGCFSTFFATLGFAFAPWYWLLAVTRVIQAVGSSLSVVAGLALLTCVFTEESDRNRANSIAYDGLTVGLLLGMPFGATLYNFLGRQAPFLILAFLVLVDFLLRCLYVDDEDTSEPPHANRTAKECLRETKDIYANLLTNPDIVTALLISLVINGALGALMSSSPAFMLDKYDAEMWQIGVILVCGAAAQLTSQTLAGFVFANIIKPWILCMVGFFLYGIALVVYTFSPSLWFIILPECIARIGLGLFTCIITPLLARIVDVCYDDTANYGAVFGLYVASYNIGLAVGPFISALFMDICGLGVRNTYILIGASVFVAGFLNLRFRKPLQRLTNEESSVSSKSDYDRSSLLTQSCDRPRYGSVRSRQIDPRRGRSYSAISASYNTPYSTSYILPRPLV